MSAIRRIAPTLGAFTLASGALFLGTGSAHAAPAVVSAAPAGVTSSCSQSFLPLPDPVCQPGAYNPSVTQSTIGSTICVSGWTSTVRPPTSYTNPLKVQQIAAYGYSDTSTADYEEDHLVPLELGGAPRDPKNLWPEPRYSTGGKTAGNKDTVENKLKTAVCNHQVTLDAARSAIASDWTTALAAVGLS
ncbi:hypothetical protein ACFYZ9_17670 [Streptomyces sp. NPDC001691]|uniref:hypothetical protein n=1 Tax=unclassified Streptomyces TaxID=2593676 RepID=UPI000DEBC0BF|nr:hypothetical protein [Streptomyces sp. SDr-06]RCH67842.1 hypothetical protein DT019_16530 [Streptomyces sp. SDr-06]